MKRSRSERVVPDGNIREEKVLKRMAQRYGTVQFTSSQLQQEAGERLNGRNVSCDAIEGNVKYSPHNRQGEVRTATTSTQLLVDRLKSSVTSFGTCTNVSERYEKLNRIGEGTYGAVYRARDKLSNGIVALKRCFPHHEATDGFPVTTLREISLLRECCGCPYIVNLREVAVSSNRSGIFLVFDYYEHDLGELIDAYYATHQKQR